jgi:hypothetical protein
MPVSYKATLHKKACGSGLRQGRKLIAEVKQGTAKATEVKADVAMVTAVEA